MNFEEFVRKNKESFDLDFPKEDTWNEIENQLIKRKRRPLWNSSGLLKIAAAFVIGLSIGALCLNYFQKNASEQNFHLADVSPELAELEYHYAALEASKMEKILEFDVPNGVEQEKLISVMKELKTEFELLKTDLADNSKDEVVIASMIENYQLRIKILDHILNNTSNEKKYHHEYTEL